MKKHYFKIKLNVECLRQKSESRKQLKKTKDNAGEYSRKNE